MKKTGFSGLIFCGLLLAAAQTIGQPARPNDTSVNKAAAPPVLHASLGNDNANRKVVLFTWPSGDEHDVNRYVLQKSTDSILFNPLHELKPHAAKGNTTDSLYQDEDPYPAASRNYYRLATILKNGNTIYSPVVHVDVDINGAQTPAIVPALVNVNGTLRMDNFYHQPFIVDLYDEGGAHLGSYSYAANSPTFYINTGNLHRGTLVYRISDEHHAFLNAGKILLQ